MNVLALMSALLGPGLFRSREGPSPHCWADRRSPWQRSGSGRSGSKPPVRSCAERRRRRKIQRQARKLARAL